MYVSAMARVGPTGLQGRVPALLAVLGRKQAGCMPCRSAALGARVVPVA